jgi:hypothetical protein
MMPRMNKTLRLKLISAMSRYLLPPISKTMYGATKSAVLNACFTSAKLTQVAHFATLYQRSRGLHTSRYFWQKVRIALWLTTFIEASPMVP